jgi:RHS repeat-associated protein
MTAFTSSAPSASQPAPQFGRTADSLTTSSPSWSSYGGGGQDTTQSSASGQMPSVLSVYELPSQGVSLPKPGGAISSLGEKFAINPSTGTSTFSIPCPVSPNGGRGGPQPSLSLEYNSGSGNGLVGFGWSISGLGAISRKTDTGIPRYQDGKGVYTLAGAEDLVPVLSYDATSKQWNLPASVQRVYRGLKYAVCQYRPRIDTVFAVIELWTEIVPAGIATAPESHWKVITGDNHTSLYGLDAQSRVTNPDDPSQVFSWLFSSATDDRGNKMIATYKAEDSTGLELSPGQLPLHEKNRTPTSRSAARYPKSIKYGNTLSTLSPDYKDDDSNTDWHFQVVFDYGDHDMSNPLPGDTGNWLVRNDPFSSYRAGFEVRTYRLCQRILMYHNFPNEAGVGRDCLIKSLDFAYRSSVGQPDEAKKGSASGSFIASFTGYAYKRKPEGGYLQASVPPVELQYSISQLSLTIQEMSPIELASMPSPADGTRFEFLDLYGEGLPGILIQAGSKPSSSWFYKRPLGNAQYGPPLKVPFKPSYATIPSQTQIGKVQFADINGDGVLEILNLDKARSGYSQKKTWEPPPSPNSTESPLKEESWEPFRPFESQLQINWSSPDVQIVDLTGNGRPDVLVIENDTVSWYPSLETDGFGPLAGRVSYPIDEEDGPRLVLTQSSTNTMVFLADMTGDGLRDVVRIRDGDISYWPNLGYARFGKKIAMGNAPLMEFLGCWDPRRVRLADVDGTGTTDMLYLGPPGSGGTRIYLNQFGNTWSAAIPLPTFPTFGGASLTDVQIVDVLGNGTACLVWHSSIGFQATGGTRRFCYIELTGGIKPNLLTSMINNMGAESYIEYDSSVSDYLADRAAGRPWHTSLPFPIQIVRKVDFVDRIEQTFHTSRYAYHNGFFDGGSGRYKSGEREFRGFAMVEQWDTEAFEILAEAAGKHNATANVTNTSSHVPPTLIKSWYHVGAWLGSTGGVYSNYLQDQFWGGQSLLSASALPTQITLEYGGTADHVLTADEMPEAARSLRGSLLRQEIFALDGTEKESRPYAIEETSYKIEVLQPAFMHGMEAPEDARPVFNVRSFESVNIALEREADIQTGRISHDVTLETDFYGNVVKAVSIAYGRRGTIPLEDGLTSDDVLVQEKTYATLSISDYTNPLPSAPSATTDIRLLPIPYETQSFQLLNCGLPNGMLLFSVDDIQKWVVDSTSADEIPFEDYNGDTKDHDHVYRRLLAHARALYRKNDMTGPLPGGIIEHLVLPYQSYRKILTPALVTDAIVNSGKFDQADADSILENQGRFLHLDGGADWWAPSNKIFFCPDPLQDELSYAMENFFLPQRSVDPFDTHQAPTTSYVTYDVYNLHTLQTRDALRNLVTTGTRDWAADGQPIQSSSIDYRLLAPTSVMDPNGNQASTLYDIRGNAVALGVQGKPGETFGDLMQNVTVDLDQSLIDQFFANPLTPGLAASLLGDATTRTIYDPNTYYRWVKSVPTGTTDIPSPCVTGQITRQVHSTDGPLLESEIQIALSYLDGTGEIIQSKTLIDAAPLPGGGSSNTAQLSTTPQWATDGWTIFNNKGLPVQAYEPFFSGTHVFEYNVQVGVSSTNFYDPLGRTVAILNPDHSWAKIIFDCWRKEMWDVNDTVGIVDPRDDPDVGIYFTRLAASDSSSGTGSADPSPLFWPTWYAQRSAGQLGVYEQRAAQKALVHAQTPNFSHWDALERPVVEVSQNKYIQDDGSTFSELLASRTVYDIQGNIRQSIDATGRVVSTGTYDMRGLPILTWMMDIGRKWFFNDVEAKTIYSWNESGDRFATVFDTLGRATSTSLLKQGSSHSIIISKSDFGETEPSPETKNLRRQRVRVYDQAGLVSSDVYDFKGNGLSTSRSFTQEYKQTIDWSTASIPLLPPQTAQMTLDALSRPTTITLPNGSVMRPVYDRVGRIFQLFAKTADSQTEVQYVKDIQHNAMGQRTSIARGNGCTTSFTYDPLTRRLRTLLSVRDPAKFPSDCPQPPLSDWPGCQIQNLNYFYDPAGNISGIRDDAQQMVYFKGVKIEPSQDFVYDALYRLLRATGREHSGASYDAFDSAVTGLPHPNDGHAMGRYLEKYMYDQEDNIVSFSHEGSLSGSWTRQYTYAEPMAAGGPGLGVCNRLTSTSIGSTIENYKYDVRGNMVSIPHLSMMQWDFAGNLIATSKQIVTNGGTPETTWYNYDGTGRRVRKVTERYAVEGAQPTIKSQRVYLGSVEIYEEFSTTTTSPADTSGRTLRRETLSLDDGPQKLVTIDSTIGTDIPDLTKYILSNHIGSCSIELGGNTEIVSYEEYTPYGSTSYQGVSNTSLPSKRYRFTGRERDEESGFYYQGHRYYMPRIGKWISADPVGMGDGSNVYSYCNCNPISLSDPSGTKHKHHSHHTTVGIGGPMFKGNESRDAVVARVEKGPYRVSGAMHWEGKTPVFEHLWKVGGTGPEGGTGDGAASGKPADPPGKGTGGGSSGGSPTGSPNGATDGSGTGSSGRGGTGGTGGASDPGGPADASDHGSFWERGGSTLVLGLLATVAAAIAVALLVANPVGAAVLVGWALFGYVLGSLTTALLIASAIVGVTVGITELATAGSRTAAQNRQTTNGANTAISFASSPGSMVGGLFGALGWGESGLEWGSLVGGITEGVASLAVGTYKLGSNILKFRALLKANPTVTTKYNQSYSKAAKAAAKLAGTELPSRRTLLRKVFGIYGANQPTRPNPAFGGTDLAEKIGLSHTIDRKAFEGKGWTLIESILNSPVGVKPLWDAMHYALDDLHSINPGYEALYESTKIKGPARWLLRINNEIQAIIGGSAYTGAKAVARPSGGKAN